MMKKDCFLLVIFFVCSLFFLGVKRIQNIMIRLHTNKHLDTNSPDGYWTAKNPHGSRLYTVNVLLVVLAFNHIFSSPSS